MRIKKSMVMLLVALLVVCSAVPVFAIDYSQWNSNGAYPSDVVNTEWMTPVKYLVDKKIVTGDDKGLFHPEASITRAEFATMMAKATNNTNNLAILAKLDLFTDLSGYTWAEPYINACAQAKLFEGVGDSKFAPGNNVTYTEVIAVITRTKSGASDMVAAMGSWPNNYIKYAQMYNMTGDVTITNWNAPATKGDVAKLLYRNMPKDSASTGDVNISVSPAAPTAGVAITCSATAGNSSSGTLSYAWEYDGASVGTNSSSCTITGVTVGDHTITVTVTKSETGKKASSTTATKTITVAP